MTGNEIGQWQGYLGTMDAQWTSPINLTPKWRKRKQNNCLHEEQWTKLTLAPPACTVGFKKWFERWY